VPGHWDEAFKPAGFPRRHWRKLATSIARMGRPQFDRRWRSGQLLIQANGVAYNVYGDPEGRQRPWPMDPLPMVVSEEEWSQIETGITQRANLLNRILGDVYGTQQLLQNGALPPELVLANPSFLRPCHGVDVPGQVRLHSYAVDLARSPDGQWWVIADRTQAPSGSGYALENRLVSARTLPNIFNHCSVRQLGRFFQNWRDGLLTLAPGKRRAVVLTPGPYNETYFEHSYLARFWSLPLVEGADLTVRDDRVYLKTLAGLEPIDFIIRRQDDSYCDPLELRSDSLLGVAGLIEAVRQGNVVVANSLGSGLVETPALMPFLPGLCQQLFGEDLVLPSVATWWSGQAPAKRYLLENLKGLVIKPAFPRYGKSAVFGADLDERERAALAREIEDRPEQFVGQEQVALSHAPVWTQDGLTSRHVVMRVFAAWDGSGYAVMPGGLTRVSSTSTSLVVSMQHGGGSKDTWVLGTPQTDEAPQRHQRDEAQIDRPIASLPSRVADNLFWLGRYTERVEAVARLMRVLLPSLSGEEDFGRRATLEMAVTMLVGYGHLPKSVLANSLPEQRRQLDRVLTTLIHDPTGASGILWNAKQIQRVAWQLKDRLSADTWRVLQQLETDFARTVSMEPDQRLVSLMTLLDRTVVSLSAFAGLLMESTTRGHGWRFLDIGRRLERGLQMILLLRHGLAAAPEDAEPYLEMLLEIADSTITYRTRYVTTLRADLVLDLLLIDETNPRSLAFQIAALAAHVEQLPDRDVPTGRHSLEKRLTMMALTSARLAHVEDLTTCTGEGRILLRRFLDELEADLLDLSQALTGKYLSHLMPSYLRRSS
jgi:uncharacterized circularly permuted ATP-grasp superfamily protein/uncharacterized alpha-E superfamily protein